MRSSVVLIGDPILRQSTTEVKDFSLIEEMGRDMYQIMLKENGIGLAANQVGLSLRFFIMKRNDSYDVYVNPEILSCSEPTLFEGEGCLSIPGASAATNRFNNISLRWRDEHGITKEGDFSGIEAFAVQHEMDHLNGKLYIDQFGSLKKKILLDKHKKFLRTQGKQ